MSAQRAARPKWAGVSDIGRVRAVNEDAYVVEPPLFAVADGLGGHQAGEIASEIAVETLVENAPRRADAKALARAVRQANRAVMEAAEEGRGRSGMGTTMTAAMIEGTRVMLAHVGDSRAYLMHDGGLRRITQDHSLVADMVRQGQITEEESRRHPVRSVITRALGSDADMVADSSEIAASPGDRLLLATDGLHGMLTDDEIAAVLREHADPGTAARALVEAALEAGGQDNVTVVVADIEGGSDPSPSARSRARAASARVLWVLAALAIVAAGTWGAWEYARSQAFLVAEGDPAQVVVYRGVPGEFAGLRLSWRERETRLPVSRLATVTRERLGEGIRVGGMRQADAAVRGYRAYIDSTSPSGGIGWSPQF